MMLCSVQRWLDVATKLLYNHKILNIQKRLMYSTLVDVCDIASVESLVRKLDSGNGTDDLLQRLTRIYERFPPSEKIMRRLSLMQQEYNGHGTLVEFCIICVYIVTMEVVPRISQQNIRRIHTMPELRKKH